MADAPPIVLLSRDHLVLPKDSKGGSQVVQLGYYPRKHSFEDKKGGDNKSFVESIHDVPGNELKVVTPMQ